MYCLSDAHAAMYEVEESLRVLCILSDVYAAMCKHFDVKISLGLFMERCLIACGSLEFMYNVRKS